MDWSNKVDRMEAKIKRVADKIERLQSANASLQQENDELKTQLAGQQEKVNVLKDKLNEAQRSLPVPSGEGPERSKKLNKQIDQYIREIDKCIEWLQNA